MTHATESLDTAYTDAHVAAVQMCQRIAELLFELPAPDSNVEITWGHVADLSEVRSRLQAVIDWLERPTT